MRKDGVVGSPLQLTPSTVAIREEPKIFSFFREKRILLSVDGEPAHSLRSPFVPHVLPLTVSETDRRTT